MVFTVKYDGDTDHWVVYAVVGGEWELRFDCNGVERATDLVNELAHCWAYAVRALPLPQASMTQGMGANALG